MTRFGDVMPMKRRLELVEYSEAHGALVLEDDYDNDFLYASRPTPSLYALATADNVVYMSSFANVLTPGIRISFMVLPRDLADAYREQIWRFSQTASKTEQIALCGYIRDGHIGAQIRNCSGTPSVMRSAVSAKTACRSVSRCPSPARRKTLKLRVSASSGRASTAIRPA